jgi:hypothetical protein
MKKRTYLIIVVAFVALAAFNANLAVSNKSYLKRSSSMNLTPMNNEKLVIKYTCDASGNMKERKVVLEVINQYAMSRQNTQAGEPDKTAEEIKKEDIFSEVKITAYPNPNQGLFWIRISGIDLPQDARLEIFTASGAQIINRKIISVPHAVDISDRPSGVYFLRITFGNDYENVWRIVKN